MEWGRDPIIAGCVLLCRSTWGEAQSTWCRDRGVAGRGNNASCSLWASTSDHLALWNTGRTSHGSSFILLLWSTVFWCPTDHQGDQTRAVQDPAQAHVEGPSSECGWWCYVALFPGPCPKPYCKRQEAGWGPGNKASCYVNSLLFFSHLLSILSPFSFSPPLKA